MLGRVFLDTAFAIALSSEDDGFHGIALNLADSMEAGRVKMITTRAVLLEVGNALAKLRFRAAAIELLHSIEVDSRIEIVEISSAIYQRAFDLYRSRLDKEWGLIDCISFVVMQENRVTEALTTDIHFRQMGFTVLMR